MMNKGVERKEKSANESDEYSGGCMGCFWSGESCLSALIRFLSFFTAAPQKHKGCLTGLSLKNSQLYECVNLYDRKEGGQTRKINKSINIIIIKS